MQEQRLGLYFREIVIFTTANLLEENDFTKEQIEDSRLKIIDTLNEKY